jgi:transposase-like protein
MSAKWVERWKDSGLTAKEFAAEAGLKASALYYWRSQLSAAGRKSHDREDQPMPSSGTVAAKPTKRSPKTTSHFVELPIASLTQTPAMLELLFGEVRVRVPSGFDAVTLTRVVRALGVSR